MPGGGGYIAQRIFSARDERHGLLSVLWFNLAHYALRPWPWILTALAAVVLYPGLAQPPVILISAMIREEDVISLVLPDRVHPEVAGGEIRRGDRVVVALQRVPVQRQRNGYLDCA